MWHLTVPWWEIVLRSMAMSIFVLFLIRLRNRGGGELSATDLVLLFSLGNIAANAAMKSDDSVSAAMISMTTFVATSALFNFIGFKWRRFELLIEGAPKVLIHNGILNEEICRQERLTHQDVMRAVREGGVLSVNNVHVAIIETNGKISVIPRQENSTSNSQTP
jgi:uncharacterized membrane protein YcaP (DUF421 family)